MARRRTAAGRTTARAVAGTTAVGAHGDAPRVARSAAVSSEADGRSADERGRDDLAARARDAAAQLRDRGDDDLAALVEELFDGGETTRRRLIRLGFDLHDGSLQSLAAMAADLRHFQSQLETMLAGVHDGEKLVARIDDAVARTLAIGESLRNLVLGAESTALSHAPISVLVDALADGYTGFAIRVSVEPVIDDLALTDSQRVAVVRVIKGALDNVAQHSGAKLATVTVRELGGGVEAEIVDDGSGFDVEGAGRSGRAIGLNAMRERIALLDGALTIESRPGGPTRVNAKLPAWRPLDAGS